MGKKPLQFQAPEKLRKEIEEWVEQNDMTLSEFLRQSARLYMIIHRYTKEGYSVALRKGSGGIEKEVILP